jgi:hypothetical protein
VRKCDEIVDWYHVEAEGPVLCEAGQQLPVGAERDAPDGRAGLGHGQKLRARLAVPHPHGPVEAAGGQAGPVRAEGGVKDRTVVALQG